MTGRDSAAATVATLLLVVIWALLLRAGLALWVDCGQPCGHRSAASVPGAPK